MLGRKYCTQCWIGHMVLLMAQLTAQSTERFRPIFPKIPTEQSLAVLAAARDSGGNKIRKEAYDKLVEIVEVEVIL